MMKVRRFRSRRAGNVLTFSLALLVLAVMFALHRGGMWPFDALDATASITDVPPGKPVIPALDTTNMQPRVARLFDETRRRVLDQPHSAQAWGKLGAVCEVHVLREQAEVCYRRAHALAPDDFRWTYFLAIVLDALGRDTQESIDLYREAARDRPRYAPLWFRFAETLAGRGQLELARDSYRKALEFDDTLAIAHYGVGQILLKLGDSQAAVHHLERASTLAPNDGPTMAALAQAYMRIGDDPRALRASDASRRLSPDLALNDPVRGMVHALGASSNVCYDRAVQLLKSGRPQEALPYLRTLERVRPEDPKVRLWSAFAHLRLGDRERSRSYLDTALRLKEALEDADRTIAPLPTARRQLDETIHEFRREYLEAVTRHGDARELRRAIRKFEQASNQVPLSATAQITWGNALLKIGEPAKARLRYLESVRLDPENADAYFNLGLIADKLGKVEEAIAYFGRAAEISPDQELTRRLANLKSRLESP
ncbi:MAG: tetratricopeptide repeat protein [Planctomycetes bacterium]|nr:tetratricopeptide repeat protein [Planctomycetota bacterium]